MAGIGRISTDYGTLLLAIKTQMQTVFNTVYLSLQPQPLVNPPDRLYCCIVPGKPVFDQGAMEGGGISWTYIKAHVAIILWADVSLDQVQRQDSFLTDTTLGVLTAWNSVLNAMTIWDAQDAGGNLLLAEPMRPVEAEITPANVPGWAWFATAYECNWNQTMTGSVSA